MAWKIAMSVGALAMAASALPAGVIGAAIPITLATSYNGLASRT